jgi:hypothetical protein
MKKSMFDRDVTYGEVLDLPSVYVLVDTTRDRQKVHGAQVKDGITDYYPLTLYTTLENALGATESIGWRLPAWLRLVENFINWPFFREKHTYNINSSQKIIKGSIAAALGLARLSAIEFVTFDPYSIALGEPVLLMSVEDLIAVSKVA